MRRFRHNTTILIPSKDTITDCARNVQVKQHYVTVGMDVTPLIYADYRVDTSHWFARPMRCIPRDLKYVNGYCSRNHTAHFGSIHNTRSTCVCFHPKNTIFQYVIHTYIMHNTCNNIYGPTNI